MKTLTLVPGMLGLLMIGATGLSAQCEKCQEQEMGGPHRFVEIGDGVFFECEPNTCHDAWANGSCSTFHYNCPALAAGNLDAAAEILQKGSGGVSAAIAMFTDARLNMSGSSLDIYCADALVARISVPPRPNPGLTARELERVGSAGSWKAP